MSYERNHLLYDYYNFPEEMYKVKFESQGSPEVAKRIAELLTNVSRQLILCLTCLEQHHDENIKTRTRSRSRCIRTIQTDVSLTMSHPNYRSIHGRVTGSSTFNEVRGGS